MSCSDLRYPCRGSVILLDRGIYCTNRTRTGSICGFYFNNGGVTWSDFLCRKSAQSDLTWKKPPNFLVVVYLPTAFTRDDDSNWREHE